MSQVIWGLGYCGGGWATAVGGGLLQWAVGYCGGRWVTAGKDLAAHAAVLRGWVTAGLLRSMVDHPCWLRWHPQRPMVASMQNRMRSPQHPCFVQHANLNLVISPSESDCMVTQVDFQGVVLHAWPQISKAGVHPPTRPAAF